MKYTFFKKIAIVACVIAITVSTSFAVFPQNARAQEQNPLTVPSGTGWDPQSIMKKFKDFVWDNLATLIAKQILHRITASTVEWINRGFEGSPSFISNPGGFFINAADQVTGAFLDQDNGPLKNLCGDLSSDLTLALAFGQVSSPPQNYECTLGTIFNNVKNIPQNTRVNGRSLQSFMKGDFSQGGWNGFIRMTTQPQNNPTGAYLQAHSNLLSAIGVKKNAINKDLMEGRGLLSQTKCSDVSSQVDQEDYNSIDSLRDNSNRASVGIENYGETDFRRSVDSKTGAVKYQRCETTTPGSLVAGLLEKSAVSPIVELELADSINSVVNALVGQMVSTIMQGGLSGLSKGGSGGSPSYTNQVIQNALSKKEKESLQSGLIVSTSAATEFKGIYDQAVSLITDSKTNYVNARACFAGKTGLTNEEQRYAQDQITAIDVALASRVDPLLKTLKDKQMVAAGQLAQIENNNNSITDAQSLDDLHKQINTGVQQAITTNVQTAGAVAMTSSTVNQDLKDTQIKSATFNGEAVSYKDKCDNISVYASNFFHNGKNY